MKFFTWRNEPSWIAVAHAESVTKARELLLGEVGGIDGSCVVRARARKVISEDAPEIWTGPNAEFALTDSAELEEQNAESTRLDSELTACNAERVAALNRATSAEIAAGEAQEREAQLAAALETSRQWAINWKAVYPHMALPEIADTASILAARDTRMRREGAMAGINAAVEDVDRLISDWSPEESHRDMWITCKARIRHVQGRIEAGEVKP